MRMVASSGLPQALVLLWNVVNHQAVQAVAVESSEVVIVFEGHALDQFLALVVKPSQRAVEPII